VVVTSKGETSSDERCINHTKSANKYRRRYYKSTTGVQWAVISDQRRDEAMTVSMDHTRRQANYCMDYRSISALTSIIAFRSVISCAARSPVQRSVTLLKHRNRR